jgi:hypothetical protein
VGPLLAGFVLLPAIGEKWTLVALSLPFFACGLWPSFGNVAAPSRVSSSRLRALFVATAVATVLLVTLTRDFESLYPKASVRRDYTATSIAAGSGMNKWLLVNGVGMTTLTPITKMMVHLPMASLDSPARNVLILCFGMGTSFRSALSWGVPATVVELVPSVPSLFGYFHANGDQLLRSPQAEVVIDDARRFLERTRQTYDVIVIDPPPPVTAAGSSMLYSTEFYRVALRRLRPGGILQQWLPNGDTTTTSAFAQSLERSFQDVRVFGSVEGWGLHFLASASPIKRLGATELAARLSPAAQRDLLEWGPASNVLDQFQTVLDREQPLSNLIRANPHAPLLTDDRPVNEYYLLRATLSR